MDDWRAATLTPLVGTRFNLRGPDGGPGRALVLEAVEPFPGSDGRSFSLTFRDPLPGVAPQGTYVVDHDSLGEFALFIVPLAPDGAGGQRYEAVFNRG